LIQFFKFSIRNYRRHAGSCEYYQTKEDEMASKDLKAQWLIIFMAVIGFALVFGITEIRAQAQKTLIDLNTASEKELEDIKGVGPATAKKIIAGRPYKSVDELKKAGIPDKTIESMKPLVKVGTATSPAKPAAETKPAAPAKAVAETKPATPPKPAALPTPPKEAAKEAPAKAVQPSAPAPAAAPAPATPSKTTAEKAKAPAKSQTATPVKLAPGQKINLNTATKEQLEALPEIGPVKAQSIIDGRPYKTTEDVMKVKGIKEGTFNKIKDYITVQ
jgi:competence protein ComEA